MHLKVGSVKGRKYLSIAHGYRDAKTGKARTKTIRSLGYLDVLEGEFPDPIKHFKEVAEEMNRQEAEARAPINVAIDRNELISSGRANRKNLGYVVLSKLYYELGLDIFFNNNARGQKMDYNVNNVMKLLLFSRILSSSSKKRTFENKDCFFEKFDFSLPDVYRFLTFANSKKENLKLHLHRKITEQYSRNTGVVYYDVTNYYFEIDRQDALRKKGVSKEHRPSPIVQMGLFMDTAGLPISYELFPGNTNDCSTLIPFLAKTKREYGIGRIIVVADKGLNTGMNVAFNLIKGDGYVYSQTIRGGHKELKDYALDDAGYREVGGGRIKSRIYPREIQVIDKNGKRVTTRVSEKQVVLYSEKYDRKAKAEREAVIAKAAGLVNNPGAYNRATSYGAAKYVKNLSFGKDGEILTAKQRPALDTDRILEEEKFDGYYAIVTSESDKSDEEIVEIYRGLWKIEESFKVTKSDLKTRPVYLSREDRIQAHFLICFIALIIARILEMRLDGEFSVSEIIESLNSMSASHLEENWYMSDYSDSVTEAINEKMGIDLRKKYLSLGEIRQMIGETKKRP